MRYLREDFILVTVGCKDLANADGVDNAVSDSNAGGFSEVILDVIINQHVEDD